MIESAFKWLLYFAAVAGVLYLGWNEPLRYRFMSRAEIDETEHPVFVEPTPIPKKAGHWMWDGNPRTSLDIQPYKRLRNRQSPGSTPYPNPP
jgi:hypothetical protein